MPQQLQIPDEGAGHREAEAESAARSLTLSGPAKVIASSAGRWRLWSEPRSLASCNTTGGGTRGGQRAERLGQPRGELRELLVVSVGACGVGDLTVMAMRVVLV